MAGFNPGLGFRSVATYVINYVLRRCTYVSIPVWVFGPSRPHARDDVPSCWNRFNPGLGFRSVATILRRVCTEKVVESFNPGLGFRSVAT